jgi:hypothetical protein
LGYVNPNEKGREERSMRNVIRKFVLFGMLSLFFPGCKAEAPVLPGTAPQAVEVKSDEITLSWDPAVLEEYYEVRYRVIRVEDEAAYQKLAAGAGKWVAKTGRVRSDFLFYTGKTTTTLDLLMPGEEILVAVLAVSGETYAYSVYPLLKVRTLTVEEESQRRNDRLLQADRVLKYPQIPNAITRMEYPEYHSFIYRYERMRDEQLDLLEASIEQYGLKVDMANSQSLNSAGYGLYEKKDYAGAARFFREAAYADPSNVYPHYNLACTLSLIRDSIWADPDANMDYHHDYNEDYYATKYNLYEPDGNYYHQADNDELCRNEIFDHLTIACLLDRQYLAKAPTDRDLVGIQSSLRFARLMERMRAGNETKIYGIWYNPAKIMKGTFFMLDGSIMQILPNDRPSYDRTIEYNDYYNNNVLMGTEKKYSFSEFTTGYEGFDNGGGDVITAQWDYKGGQLIINHQIIIRDFFKLRIAPKPSKPLEFNYDYFEDKLKVIASSTSLSIDSEDEYINIYTTPYRYVLEGSAVDFNLEDNEVKTINILASLAVIYDRMNILDMLLVRSKGIDTSRLFLLSCLYSRFELLSRLENGEYGFDINKFLAQNGTTLLNYAAASGNVPLFKMIHTKYYQKVISGLSKEEKEFFLRWFWGWSDITGNCEMNDLIHAIRDGE